MPKPTKGGQGPPQGAPGGDFDSFWSASRTSRGPKKGVRKMDRKMDPQKIDFWRILRRVRADPGGVCGWHLGLKLTNSNSCSARLAPRRGRRIQSLRALRQAREEGFQKKVKPIEQFPLKLNGNSIQVVSRGACDRKGALQGSILSLRWVVKMSQNCSRTPL